MTYKCHVQPLDISLDIDEGENLLSALKRNNIAIKSSCGGCSSCGDCVIKILGGEENIEEMDFDEEKLLGNVFHITKERLSCQTRLRGDVTIDVSIHQESQIKVKPKAMLRKKSEQVEVEWTAELQEKKIFKAGGKKRPKKFNFSDD